MQMTAAVENAEEFQRFWEVSVMGLYRRGLRRAVNRAAREGAKEAKDRHTFRNRSTDLEKSIGAITDAGSTSDDFGAEIVALERYASFVDGGTKAHVIEARRAAVLRFVNQSGNVIYRLRVHHPGSRAHPFMGFAYFKAERVLQREIEITNENVQRLLDQP